jgi:murein L,D-transpeptidase YcbB/YkuD
VLRPGDLIGYVGHTGNAIATAPHLHFEVHDQTGVAVDPFPRLTMELSVAQKIQYLTPVLNIDPVGRDALSDLVVSKAKADVVAAKTQGVVLPEALNAALLRNMIATGTTTVVSGNSTGTLKVGSRGPLVVALQTFLLKKNVGSASRIVADGSFGPITKQALIDYQTSVGLTADGVYGPKSAAYVAAHQ